ncbi:TPA: CRISPR-associated endonuclease Cas2 [Patescibacteria group bacterium]|nr:CRISPR-associated endonuclease Cas2 [Patescibacteria group bacterium]
MLNNVYCKLYIVLHIIMKNNTPKTKRVLGIIATILADIGEASIELSRLPSIVQHGHLKAYGRGGLEFVAELQQAKHKQYFNKTINSLIRRRYLEAKKIGHRVELFLTNKGQTATTSQRLLNASLHTRWNFTVVVFDIPRTENAVRRRFRWLLRQGGFLKLQHSVWISRRQVYKIMAKLINDLGLKKWVNVFEGQRFLVTPK